MGATKKFTSKIAANGQVVVPIELRVLLSLQGGDSIVFVAEQDDAGLFKIMIRKPTPSFKGLVGAFAELSGSSHKDILKAIDREEMK